MENRDVLFDENGDIIDCLSGKALKDTPEERVRQRFISILQTDYGYPKNQIAREIPIQQGSKILTSSVDGTEIRADIVVYVSKKACLEKDQGNILFVVECKKPNVTEGYPHMISVLILPYDESNIISVIKQISPSEKIQQRLSVKLIQELQDIIELDKEALYIRCRLDFIKGDIQYAVRQIETRLSLAMSSVSNNE